MAASDFWDKPEEAQKTVGQLKILKKIVEPWKKANESANDLFELAELLDANQPEALSEFQTDVKKLTKEIDVLEFQRLLSDPLDKNNAIFSINAGAGGTESCDWAGMLFRMYSRWAEGHDYKVGVVDLMQGEEAGIKSVTVMIEGPFAYGYLKAETGVHRLVRISPFDANKRRHTSFASVNTIAEVEDTSEIEVRDVDVRIDTYRAGGAGGQHVNKTESAVRITHIETGISSQCQNERSQFQNKQVAFKILKARLYQHYLEKKEAEEAAKYGPKKKIEWGSQIRSYVFHPYSMVKDHRTLEETSNVLAVMDGDIDEFIVAYLKKQASSC